MFSNKKKFLGWVKDYVYMTQATRLHAIIQIIRIVVIFTTIILVPQCTT